MKYLRHLRNESGLSLIELLATLVITTFIGIIAYTILFGGFKTYDRVIIETSLRDEADIIMAEMINGLFLLKNSDIKEKHFPEQNTNNYYFKLEDNKKIGFVDGKVFMKDERKNILQSNLIELVDEDTKIIELDDGQYKILIALMWKENEQQLNLETEINIIMDNEEEG